MGDFIKQIRSECGRTNATTVEIKHEYTTKVGTRKGYHGPCCEIEIASKASEQDRFWRNMLSQVGLYMQIETNKIS